MFELVQILGINAVGHQGQTDAVAGEFADQEAEKFVTVGEYQSEIAANAGIEQHVVDVHRPQAMIHDDYTFVERGKYALHLKQPIGL